MRFDPYSVAVWWQPATGPVQQEYVAPEQALAFGREREAEGATGVRYNAQSEEAGTALLWTMMEEKAAADAMERGGTSSENGTDCTV